MILLEPALFFAATAEDSAQRQRRWLHVFVAFDFFFWNQLTILLEPTFVFATKQERIVLSGDDGRRHDFLLHLIFCWNQQSFLLQARSGFAGTGDHRGHDVFLQQPQSTELQPLLVFATTNKTFCYIHQRRSCTAAVTFLLQSSSGFATTDETFCYIHSWLTGGRCLQNPVRRARRRGR